MESVVVPVPALWADHHVLAVRETLSAQPGVQRVEASSRDRRVTIEFDPAQTDGAALEAALAAAGYETGAARPPEPRKDKPAWAGSGVRVTATNQLDLSMSGDYRKY